MTLGISAGGAALLTGALGAGVSAYGASQQPKGIGTGSVPVSGWNPNQDPLLSALSMNAGVGIGQFDPNIYRQASPAQQLINQAMSSGTLTRREMRQLQGSLNYSPEVLQQGVKLWQAVKPREGGFFKSGIGSLSLASLATGGLAGLAQQDKDSGYQGGPDTKKAWKKYLADNGMTESSWKKARRGMEITDRLAKSAGYENSEGLYAANQAYLDKLPEIQSQYQPVADQLRAGTLASQSRIGQYMQDLPNLLTGDANPFIDQLREEALINSQKYGMNPYKGLEEARSQALQRALQLISGEQAVQGAQQQAALPVAQLRQQGGATAAGIGAGQAQMLAGALQSQQAAQSAQAQTWGNLGTGLMQGAFGALGAQQGPAAQQYPSNNYTYGME